jgi:hypothetical protein
MIVIISRFIFMLLSFCRQRYLRLYIYKAATAAKVTEFQALETFTIATISL